MKFPEFKIRCSKISDIMADPTKAEIADGKTLSKGCMTYLDEWIGNLVHESETELTSKYLDKGNIMEDDAIDMLADYLDAGMFVKNTEFFENEYTTGTPDVKTDILIADAKCSWVSKTFPMLKTVLPDKNYDWQVLGYLDITDRKKGIIAYCLLNTPLHLIKSAATSWCYKNGYEGLQQAILDKYIKNMTYDNIPRKYRISTFEVIRNDARIESIHKKVIDCRKYIKQKLDVLAARPDF